VASREGEARRDVVEIVASHGFFLRWTPVS
jgi:hypothetical protein